MLTPERPRFRGYSARELQAEAEYEANMRRKVYSNRVMTHRMTKQSADRKIDMMAAIAEHFAELAEGERLL
jgi:hypothetical protein